LQQLSNETSCFSLVRANKKHTPLLSDAYSVTPVYTPVKAVALTVFIVSGVVYNTTNKIPLYGLFSRTTCMSWHQKRSNVPNTPYLSADQSSALTEPVPFLQISLIFNYIIPKFFL